MRYLVTAEEMYRYERHTIENIGIPAMVLMERAALAVQTAVLSYCEKHAVTKKTVLVMAGTGNNGADGLAVARLLAEQGFQVEVWTVGKEERASLQWTAQKKILLNYSVKFSTAPQRDEYTILIDALFGVGLSREVAGSFGDAVEAWNGLMGHKIAIDIPSGIDSDTGKVMGKAVRADETVTFGFYKRGLVLSPGCEYAGGITLGDIGVSKVSFGECAPGMVALDESTEELLPVRDSYGNKGTFGKVLLIAGSLNMAGAAVLAAKAAYRVGAGMVKVITPEENRVILQQTVPEALLGTGKDLEESLKWADVIAIGPGLGKSGIFAEMLEKVLRDSSLPLVIDADGLNLLAERPDLRRLAIGCGAGGRKVIFTPHVGELARLAGKSIAEVKEDFAGCGSGLTMEFQAVIVAKDARTFVCSRENPICVNLSGNSGLATAGSGDVLAGMIAGLLAQGMEPYRAACVGACIHGRAGDRVAAEIGEHACMAGDLVSEGGAYGKYI